METIFTTESGRELSYYGVALGEQKAEFMGKAITLNELFAQLIQVCDIDTAVPYCQHDYDKANDPTYGQGAVFAMIVQDIFGGTLHKKTTDDGGRPYFNQIDGNYIDLARDQFDLYDIEFDYEPNQLVNRQVLDNGVDVSKRYQLLKERLVKALVD
ncbi:hypothetical protein NHG29_07030 [Aerococcaceae bacterium NML160702]|nr:hypothetical protein [Aerococcaceae bacterium NML171108]MCW6682628.1 hypothetical protein [Aerococcaceae bacterium NML160702]